MGSLLGLQSVLRKEWLLLLIVIFFAIIFRLYRLSEQSLWHEEYVVLSNIQIADLWTNIKLLFVNVPEYGISPGGLVLYYFWVNLFPQNLWAWRILPIFFGVLSITLVYFFGRLLMGKTIGLFASLMMALSPFHIYIHQELKNYAFLLFLSLLSWLAFYNYTIRTKKSYWLILASFINLILPWFHALYIFVPFLQFPLLLIYKLTKKQKLLWISLNSLICLPFVLFILLLKPPAYNLSTLEIERLSLPFIITTLFGNDSVGISNELLPSWKTNSPDIISSHFWRSLIQNWFVFDYVLLLLIVLSFLGLLLYLLKNRKKEQIEEKYNATIFLIYSFSVPAIFFLLLRIITNQSIFLPLYFYYIYAFLYLIVSAFIFSISSIKWRWVIGISLVLLLFIECMGVINFVCRPDYQKAVAYLEKNVKAGDEVLELQIGANVFETWKVYKKRDDYHFTPIFSLKAVADHTINKFSEAAITDNNPTIWVFMETTFITWFFHVDPTYMLVKNLSGKGIKVDIKHFPGAFNLYVVKLEKQEDYVPQPIPIPPFQPIDYEKLLLEFNLTTKDEKENPRRLEVLHRYFSIWPPLYSYNSILILGSMIENGETEIAENITGKLCKKNPKFYHIKFLYGLCLFLNKKYSEADEEMRSLFNDNMIFRKIYNDLWKEIKMREDNHQTLQYLERLEKEGFQILNKPLLFTYSRIMFHEL